MKNIKKSISLVERDSRNVKKNVRSENNKRKILNFILFGDSINLQNYF